MQGWVSICGTLPGCAYEGGNREEARMLGVLHVPRDLWRVGDREAPGVNLNPAGFQGQGPGNSSPAKDNQPMARAESPDVNSFFPPWSCPWLWVWTGKGAQLHLREDSGSLVGADSLILS